MTSLKEARSLPLLALLIFLLCLCLPRVAQAQDATPTPTASSTPPPVRITAPLGGEALQGVVTITGTSQTEGYQAAEVAFAYAGDPTRTWFLIDQPAIPVTEGQIAAWDTTTISDGTYHLRLQVFLSDGSVRERVVENVRVRNYTTVETSTPAPPTVEGTAGTLAAVPPTPRPTRTLAVDFAPAEQAAARTPDQLPTNPAILTTQRLRESAAVGVGAIAVVLLAAALYLSLRALFRR